MSSIVISGDTSGAITLAAPSVAGTNTATLPAATGTVMVSGNMPAFSAYPSTTFVATSGGFTLMPCDGKEWDTNSVFNNTNATVNSIPAYSFLPKVAGYYQVNASFDLSSGTSFTRAICAIYKNGTGVKYGLDNNGTSATGSNAACLIYLNGSTDYISCYVFMIGTGTLTILNGPTYTYFQATLVRSA
jgi:hypothetical protein